MKKIKDPEKKFLRGKFHELWMNSCFCLFCSAILLIGFWFDLEWTRPIYALGIFILLPIQLVSGIMLTINGRHIWWYLLSWSLFLALAIAGFVGTFRILKIDGVLPAVLICSSWAVGMAVMWLWATRQMSQENLEKYVEAKRIDFDRGTYSPFQLVLTIYKSSRTRTAMLWALGAMPLLLTINISLSNFLRRSNPSLDQQISGWAAWSVLLLSILVIFGSYLEFRFIRRWEKETGRKMYISYVVDWKRYKEEEKKRKRIAEAQNN